MRRDSVATQNSWEYQFPAPLLDTRPSMFMQPPGTFSRLVGVDGRYATELRRFPGFVKESDIAATAEDYTSAGAHTPAAFTFGANSGLTFYKSFSIQEDSNQNGILRGIIFVGKDATHVTAIFIHYYRSRTDTTYTVKAFGTGEAYDFIDITYDHRHFFFVARTTGGASRDKMLRFVSDSTPTVANEYWTTASISNDIGLRPKLTGAVFSLSQMEEHGAATPPVYGINDETGYIEKDATYGIAFRLICPEQDLYGPLSPILEIKSGLFADDQGYFTLKQDYTLPDAAWATRRYIEFYRTVAHTYSGQDKIGKLFLERRVEIATTSASIVHQLTIHAVAAGSVAGVWGMKTASYPDEQGLSDTGLVLQKDLNPIETRIFTANPASKLIQEYERLLVHVSAVTNDDTGADTEVLRYSPLIEERMNLLPVDHYRKPADLSDTVLALEKADPFLAVVYDNAILRMHRSGTRLSLDPIHNRHGAVSGAGVISLGSNLFVVSPVGLLVVDLALGQLDVLPATQHIFDDPGRWRDSLDTVAGAYDSGLGLLILMNTTEKEGVLVWMNEGVVTELEALPFDIVLTGASLEDGGVKKALFLDTTSRSIYTIDRALESTTRTMNGGSDSYDYNCYVHDATPGGAGGSYTRLTLKTLGGENPTLDTSGMDGFYAHLGRDVDGAVVTDATGEARIIDTVGATYVDVTEDFTSDPTGAMVALCGIPLRVTAWPLWYGDQQEAVDHFRVKKVTSIGSLVRHLAGDTTAGRFLHQLFATNRTTPLQKAEASITEVPADSFVTVPANAPILIPGMECITSNLQFSLLGWSVIGTHEGSRQT